MVPLVVPLRSSKTKYFVMCCFRSWSLRDLSLPEREKEREKYYRPIPQYWCSGNSVSLTFVLVDRLRKSRSLPHSHTCAPSKHVCSIFWGVIIGSAYHYISLIRIFGLRFDGVVGYRICLTHRRSPVRTRVEPSFFSSHPSARRLSLHSIICTCVLSKVKEVTPTCISIFILTGSGTGTGEARRNEMKWKHAPIKMVLRSRVALQLQNSTVSSSSHK